MVVCNKAINKYRSCGEISFSNKIILCEKCEEKERNSIFINHIKDHLKKGEVVVCKICGKSSDEIISETILEEENIKGNLE